MGQSPSPPTPSRPRPLPSSCHSSHPGHAHPAQATPTALRPRPLYTRPRPLLPGQAHLAGTKSLHSPSSRPRHLQLLSLITLRPRPPAAGHAHSCLTSHPGHAPTPRKPRPLWLPHPGPSHLRSLPSLGHAHTLQSHAPQSGQATPIPATYCTLATPPAFRPRPQTVATPSPPPYSLWCGGHAHSALATPPAPPLLFCPMVD